MPLNIEYVKTSDCVLEVTNNEAGTLLFTVEKYIDDTTTEVVADDYSIATTETLEITLDSDGVYKIFPNDEPAEIHLMVRDCGIKTNLNTISQSVLNGECDECDLQYYTSYHLAILSFYSKINSHFDIDTMFDTINAETLTVITDFIDLIAKIQDYETVLLSDCDCGCNEC